ncbi:hypothetical protein CHS0354_041815 [Potamilus streckersoni]|uniref:Fidgetin-like protein 1 n=1 Tax=Potamilus streckersoni TaxID=2493646 RepID=A0AAE0T1A3_9BIVA|nr:hypothetical protein CHS0354_041815 [Potamilus streckersoni]
MELNENHANFLHRLQSLILNPKLEDGSASEKADILRNMIVHLQYAAVTGLMTSDGVQTMKREYDDLYASVVDSLDETTGLNNFAEGALTLCQLHKNESQSWKMSLTIDKVKSNQRIKEMIATNQIKQESLVPQDKKGFILPCSKQDNNDSSAFRKGISTDTFVHTGSDKLIWPIVSTAEENVLKSRMNMGRLGQENINQHKGSLNASAPVEGQVLGHQVEQMNTSSNTGFRNNRKPLFSSGHGQGPFGQYRKNSSTFGQRQYGEPMKRSYRDMGPDDSEEHNETPQPVSSAFRTAKQQLNIENQRKYGTQGRGQGMHPYSYGTGKKSLGPRRGSNNKFVPPIMNREEDEGGNSLVSAITRSVVGNNRAGNVSGGPGGDTREDDMADERLKGIEPKMVELIMNEIMDDGPGLTWDDIAGLEFAKKTIKEIVVWPMLRPDIFTGLRGPPKGLLLFGPPGTGKTLIGKCIASQSKSTFFCISASSLTSKWVGEGEKMVRALFAVARCNQPAVVFIDEIDSLLTQRTDGENEASRRIKTEFLVQLDGAATNSDDRILVVGATNRPQEIDEAARRRFVKRLYIPLPEAVARRQIVVNLLCQQSHHLSEEELDMICQQSEGFSGADMANLCREAALGPIRSISFGDIESISADQVRPINYADFQDAFLHVKTSVSSKDLDVYLQWNKTFGSGGR